MLAPVERLYSTVVFKAVNEDQRVIEGIATVPVIDRDGDIIETGGVSYDLPMPLLWQHDQDSPIGNVIAAKVTKNNITIRAQIAPKGVTPWIDEAWALIKAGLVRGLSIAGKIDKYELIPSTGGMRITSLKWFETSAVTVPANQAATITAVKSIDAQSLAVSGERSGVSRSHRPGVTGSQRTGPPIMTNQEKLQKAKSDLETKTARLQEIVAADEPSAEDAQEQETLTSEIGTLTKTVDTLTVLEKALGAQAVPAAPQRRETTEKKHDVHVVELEKGVRFARVAMAVAAGRGSISDTLQYAKRWDGQTPEVTKFIKDMFSKAVAGTANFQSPGWGSELVYVNNVAGELIELLRSATIIDRIQGFRRGVFNTRMVRQTSGATVNWVGEGAVKPVTQLDFDTITLPYHKIAGIVVLTQELVRLSNPDAELAVRDDLVAQIARFKDSQFIDSTVTATSSRPASITNGVSSPAATGATALAFFADMNAALATFDDNPNSENLTILMPPALARGLSTLQNVNGGFVFPSLGAKGGTVMGYTVIVSGSVPTGTIIILNPADILVAQDGSVNLDASSEATLDLAGGSSPNVNLWQRNMIGIRAELACTWLKARDASVAIIDTASYGPVVPE